MTYPTLEQVEEADVEALLRWNRFLPSPTRDSHVPILERVVERLSVERARDPDAFVVASKAIGWETA